MQRIEGAVIGIERWYSILLVLENRSAASPTRRLKMSAHAGY
jgi:hypothetical protein